LRKKHEVDEDAANVDHASTHPAPPLAAALCCAAAIAWPRPAAAGNEAHVRTPVLWPSECGRVVERSVDPVAHFDYTIPYEDTNKTAEELPDSRTHQFFALCRQHGVSELLPAWITRDDVDRSVVAGLLEPDEVTYREILDETTIWTDCFVRITGDDERRPITFAEAELGVDWDTSTVAVGVWSLAGYTFEPTLNLWRDRPGFVKILDDRDDPEQDLPAIALLADEQAVGPGEIMRFEACVDVLEPARIELEWAPFQPSLEWQPLDTIEVDADGSLLLDLPAPIAAADSELLVRARLIDALGREYIAHGPVRVSVSACPEQGCSEPVAPGDEARGCSTRPRTNAAGIWILLGLLLLDRRRVSRRSARACVRAVARG
jgi:hypothetical protein